MLELYHCVSARSFRALWMLEELGLPYRLHMLPFPPRVLARDYLAINPLGTVPFLIDGTTRMSESAAICQYLCSQKNGHDLAVMPHEKDYGAFLNWLHMGEATLTFPQTLVLRYRHLEPPERQQPQVVQDYSRWFLARLRAVQAALADGDDWLCGARFTAADVSVGYALMLASHLGLTQQMAPELQHYWQRLAQRPAFKRAQQAQHDAALAQAVPTTESPDLRP